MAYAERVPEAITPQDLFQEASTHQLLCPEVPRLPKSAPPTVEYMREHRGLLREISY